MAKNVHAFEILVGLTLLRTSDSPRKFRRPVAACRRMDACLPRRHFGVTVHRADRKVAAVRSRTRTRARAGAKGKARVPVLVCLGNPPYDRQQIDPDEGASSARAMGSFRRSGPERACHLRGFPAAARDAGAGGHLRTFTTTTLLLALGLWKVFGLSMVPVSSPS